MHTLGMSSQEPLLLSGLQHFAFCRRQWALIHIEQQWSENVRTVDGRSFHRRAHDSAQLEARGDLLIARGFRITSQRLNVAGVCDVVEFHRDANGIELYGRDGRWTVYPVEYKRGAPKVSDADRLQLCGQAMCLEEMLACVIPEGSLFYGETRRREQVVFTDDLRAKVEDLLEEMRRLYDRGHTPVAKASKACNACSLKEICLPRLNKLPKVSTYVHNYTGEDVP